MIYYGSMADPYIILMQVRETKKVQDLDVATKVSVELQLTAQNLRSRDRIVKKTEKDSLYAAMDLARCGWSGPSAASERQTKHHLNEQKNESREEPTHACTPETDDETVLVVLAAMLMSVMVAAAEGTSGTVTADALRVRAGASTETEILGLLYNGTVVQLTGEEGDWYTISYNGATGYLHKDYIRLAAEDETAQAQTASAASYSMESHAVKTNIVNKACEYLGVRYIYGGASPAGLTAPVLPCTSTSSLDTPCPTLPPARWPMGPLWSATPSRWGIWCSSGIPASPPRRPAMWGSISAAASLSTPPPAVPAM